MHEDVTPADETAAVDYRSQQEQTLRIAALLLSHLLLFSISALEGVAE